MLDRLAGLGCGRSLPGCETMIGKAKPTVSTSRFCQKAVELPLSLLEAEDGFTVAVSHLASSRVIPARADSQGPIAYGVLHGGAVFSDGATEPLLPVEVHFNANPSPGHAFGKAHITRQPKGEENNFFLVVSVSDADGLVSAAFDRAMERHVLCRNDFIHLRCIVDRQHQNRAVRPPEDWKSKHLTRSRHLRAVDAGEEKLTRAFEFDRIAFDDDLYTGAGAWSWGWKEGNFSLPLFRDKRVERWRRDFLPHKLKS